MHKLIVLALLTASISAPAEARRYDSYTSDSDYGWQWEPPSCQKPYVLIRFVCRWRIY
jgi:hypothetical protein